MSEDQRPHETPPDWVTEIARCSPQNALQDLAQVIEADTAKMNDLPEGLREGCTFQFQWGDRGVDFCSVTRVCPDMKRPDQSLTFSATEESIAIATHAAAEPFRFEVRPVRQEKTGQRVVMVGDEEQELWQISCRALRDLFFETVIERTVGAA